MFFAVELLSPQHGGRFSIAWIAATRGIRYTSKKQIVDCNIMKLCNEILEMVMTSSTRPRLRLSLSLASRLTNGMAKIYLRQATILLEDLVKSLAIKHVPIKMDLDYFEKTPRVKPSRKRKRKIALSQELLPLEAPTALPELQIADIEIVVDERELARPEIHQIDSDLITLKEAIPARTDNRMNLEDMGQFGELGDDVEAALLEVLPQTDLLPPQRQILTGEDTEGSRSKKQRVTFADIVESQPVLSQLHAEIEAEIVSQVQQVATTAELPKSDGATELPRAKIRFTIPKKKELPNYTKILAKQRPRVHVNINRCRPGKDESFDLRKDEDCVPVTLVAACVDDPINLTCAAPFMEETDNWEQFIAALCKSLGSSASLLLPSSSTLKVHSRRTKTAKQSGIPKQTTAEHREPDESHHLIVPVEVHVPAAPQPTPSIEQITEVHPPILETTQRFEVPEKTVLPLAESTKMLVRTGDARNLEQPPIQLVDPTIEITAGAAAAPQRMDFITDVSPTESQELTVTKNRQKRIRSIVKDWNPDIQGDITLETVCPPPINRRNIALAFSDLLTMQKMGYVVLKNKPDSLELGVIEKGNRIIKKN